MQLDLLAAASRTATLQSLYVKNYSQLRDEAFIEGNLMVGDVDALLSVVAQRLGHYEGQETDDDAFVSWAVASIVKPGAARLVAFYAFQKDYRAFVLEAIWRIVKNCADLGMDDETVAEIEQCVWMKVFIDFDDWLKPGTAKVSTRLFAKARFEALSSRKERIRAKERFVDVKDVMRREDAETLKERQTPFN